MRTILVLCATIASVCALPAGASARTLQPSDPYDARIIAADHCNSTVQESGFAEAVLDQCKAVYDATVSLERSAQAMTPAQKSTIAIAKALSMLTITGGYTKLDGVLSARACKALEGINRALAGYDPGAPNGLEDLYGMLVKTRDTAIPKCRTGGHWPD
jgi:hypothetical protein